MLVSQQIKGVFVSPDKIFSISSVLSLSLMALITECANPVDEPPLQWRTGFGAPLMNNTYTINEKINDVFGPDENMEILNNGDTVTFATSQKDTVSYTISQKPFEQLNYSVRLGVLSIQNAPEENKSATFMQQGEVSLPFSVPLRKITRINFLDTINMFEINVDNASSFPLGNVSLSVVDTVISVQTIDAGATQPFLFNMAGKSVTDTLYIIVTFTSPQPTAGTIGIRFSMNGLKVHDMTVEDSLIAFSNEYSNRFNLNDTIKLDYIDIARGIFDYSIANFCRMPFYIKSVQDHIWNTEYSREHEILGIDSLATLPSADSTEFRGEMDDIKIEAQSLTTVNIDVSGSRLFPEWDSTESLSFCNIRYGVEIRPIGDYADISIDDSIQFTVSAKAFKYSELAGTVMRQLEHRIDTLKIALDLPWAGTAPDSMKNRFLLSEVSTDFLLAAALTGESHIDTLGLDFSIFALEPGGATSELNTVLVNVADDSQFVRSIDIADIVNSFPDTIGIVAEIRIPVYSRVKFENVVDDDNTTIGKTAIDIYNDVTLKVRMDWEVADTFNMVLGSDRMKFPDGFDYFRKMNDKAGRLTVSVLNNTNLNMSLFALAASGGMMDSLDSLTMNEMCELIKDDAVTREAGYINLLGSSGISIHERDSVNYHSSGIELDNSFIHDLLDSDSLNFRWWIRFNKQDRDALRKSDFVGIMAGLEIKATNNTDSLLIW